MGRGNRQGTNAFVQDADSYGVTPSEAFQDPDVMNVLFEGKGILISTYEHIEKLNHQAV